MENALSKTHGRPVLAVVVGMIPGIASPIFEK
jgi:hypothetical protein